MSTITQQFAAYDAPAIMERVTQELFGNSYEVVLEECVPAVLQGIRANFASSASPENSDWPERKRAGDGHPLLIESGDLMQAAMGGGPGHIRRIFGSELVMGVDGAVIPYAAIHNRGGRTRPMPRREFMGIREEFAITCEHLIADFVATGIL